MSTETLLCNPVLRHGWDGMYVLAICDEMLSSFNIANCDHKSYLTISQ